MNTPVRTRFAPSPTGEPHVGNIRTAIFAWLFARHHGGTFILRIEDTDQERKVEGATEMLMESLGWLGLDWDEGPDVGGPYGPYLQSQRLPLYQGAAQRLIGLGHAYRCYCSPERLAAMRQEQARQGKPPRYDGRCRDLGDAESARLEGEGVTPVVRFRMPTEGVTTVTDLVRGEVSFDNALLDDFVILKSDGFPTYHLAHLVDDREMRISHVLRAEEWLPSLPRHWRIYEALGWEKPLFAHLPIILAPDRSKLSKRHGATSVLEYRRMGYLPDAMLNFLALLGWSLDDKTELLSRDELVRHFSIERIVKSAAIFNRDKLDWMNGSYIRQSPLPVLADALQDYWVSFPPDGEGAVLDAAMVFRVAPLLQERIKTLADAAPLAAFFFKDRLDYDAADLVQKGMDAGATRAALEASLARLRDLPTFDAAAIEAALRPLADALGLKARQLFGVLRVATTGQAVSPPLFETMEVLGRDRTLAAVAAAATRV